LDVRAKRAHDILSSNGGRVRAVTSAIAPCPG
jgi:hypothetical protein